MLLQFIVTDYIAANLRRHISHQIAPCWGPLLDSRVASPSCQLQDVGVAEPLSCPPGVNIETASRLASNFSGAMMDAGVLCGMIVIIVSVLCNKLQQAC